MDDTHRIGSDGLSVVIAAEGAELQSLRDSSGEELLWQAGPEWPRRAPILFPTVGRLAGDTLRHEGGTYRMTQHGFARDSLFEWVERSERRAALRLTDSEASRRLYPFPFRLDVSYAAEDAALTMIAEVTNVSSETILPFCIGAHPGFRWPLVDGVEKEAHVLEFEARETGPSRSVIDGLLGAAKELPFDGRVLPLTPELFRNDALVMPGVASRSVRYVAKTAEGAEARALTISWSGYEDLGVWSAPAGAPFLCVEPWRGMASPVDWDGPFVEKPGVVRLPPGASMAFEWRVAL